ncbi:RND family efflux transporter MFP subunit [Thermincola ferriacetica]|uniref:RND family efflux transporter MFP subunit n=1 Tax=Thermincola ferriacetica TaxID=281456 RepID=A0A0L6VZH2_9FIRM|nr:hypothetical protein [Thermincola ferriacetica]KNZ68727.1 RND family efflux transporter MFP subunit [Thermincola ferriacetica]
MKTSIKKYLAASIIILVLLGIFTGIKIKQLKKVPEVQTDAGYPVETITAKTGAISEGISYVGTVEPGMEVDLADQVQSRVSRVPGAVNLYKSWSLNSPEIHVRVNEKRAAELGLGHLAM